MCSRDLFILNTFTKPKWRRYRLKLDYRQKKCEQSKKKNIEKKTGSFFLLSFLTELWNQSRYKKIFDRSGTHEKKKENKLGMGWTERMGEKKKEKKDEQNVCGYFYTKWNFFENMLTIEFYTACILCRARVSKCELK